MVKDTLDEEALICIGLQNGELLIVQNDRIVSRRRDSGTQIGQFQNKSFLQFLLKSLGRLCAGERKLYRDWPKE